MLTPLAIDPVHPFPHLLNKSLNLAVLLQRPRRMRSCSPSCRCRPCCRASWPLPAEKGPRLHRRWKRSSACTCRSCFPAWSWQHATVFRVTRNSEYEIDDDEVEDLLKTIEEEVRKRRRGAAVRLEIEADAPPEVEQFLTTALDLDALRRLPHAGPARSDRPVPDPRPARLPHLRDPQFVPQPVPEFVQASSMWAAIRARDILVHHPYESFGHVVDFIEAAADDERVLAIKQTLYRTSSDSPIVRALQRAADNGKQVTAVIELKARLDEERNILWARELEKAGVHVVFGFVGLKTHCKVALVVRREDDGIRRYVHLAPATTTRRRPASTPTWASSPATPISARTPRPCSTT